MKLISSFFILLLFGSLAYGQSRAKKIDSICQSIASKHPEIGISIGFVDDGIDYFFNYGTVNHDSKVGVDNHTIYEIGSITKVFTANLMAQAQNEGKLNISDFIDAYFPKEYQLSDEIKGKIKISDLASHQSGLPDFDFKKLMETNPLQPLDITKEQLHAVINENTKLIDYGTYRYSNMGFILMGMILEQVYGKEFETLVREKMISPVGMDETLTTDFNVKNKVVGYDGNGVAQVFFNWNPLVASAGLLKSNTYDMTKFINTILSNKGDISKATQITETTFFKNTVKEIGFGQEVDRNETDVYFYKTGNTFACSGILAYDKNTNWGMIILLSQNNSRLMAELINTSYETVLKEKSVVKNAQKK